MPLARQFGRLLASMPFHSLLTVACAPLVFPQVLSLPVLYLCLPVHLPAISRIEEILLMQVQLASGTKSCGGGQSSLSVLGAQITLEPQHQACLMAVVIASQYPAERERGARTVS